MNANKKAARKVSKPEDLAGMTRDEAVDIYNRLQAMESSLQKFMDTFVEQTPEGPILRVMSAGNRATAKKGRVGLAAKRSGWTYEDWLAKFGERTSRLTREEMALYNNSEQNRMEALHKERPAKVNKGQNLPPPRRRKAKK